MVARCIHTLGGAGGQDVHTFTQGMLGGWHFNHHIDWQTWQYIVTGTQYTGSPQTAQRDRGVLQALMGHLNTSFFTFAP
jgi:hypothetical protein